MDACAAVEKEVDKVLNKFRDAERISSNNLDELLQNLSDVQEELQQGRYQTFT